MEKAMDRAALMMLRQYHLNLASAIEYNEVVHDCETLEDARKKLLNSSLHTIDQIDRILRDP